MQEHSLLQTKLTIPRIRHELASRPRLLERCNAALPGQGASQGTPGVARKLTPTSAHASFGKTTLLSEWVRTLSGAFRPPAPLGRATAPIATAWLSLDESDNDPARFLAHFVAALQTLALPTLSPVEGTQLEGAAAHIGKALRALRSPQPPSPKAPIQEMLLPLVLFELLPGFCLVIFSVRE